MYGVCRHTTFMTFIMPPVFSVLLLPSLHNHGLLSSSPAVFAELWCTVFPHFPPAAAWCVWSACTSAWIHQVSFIMSSSTQIRNRCCCLKKIFVLPTCIWTLRSHTSCVSLCFLGRAAQADAAHPPELTTRPGPTDVDGPPKLTQYPTAQEQCYCLYECTHMNKHNYTHTSYTCSLSMMFL